MNERSLAGFLPFLVVLVATCVLALIAAGATRGFDLTDEGVHYLSAMHPVEVPDRQTNDLNFGRVLATAAGLTLTRCKITVLNLDRSVLGFPSAGRGTPVQAPQN
jgi:hypothetical protein